MKQYGFYINTDSCVGCKTCEIACKDHKNLPVGVRIRKVREYGGGKWVNKDGFLMPSDVFNYYVSMSCMHCANPACMENCPVNAITRDEEYGAVVINKEKCIGAECKVCIDACPYHSPAFDEKENKACKCDMCIDKLKEGRNPVCIDSCLQRCIEFGEIEQLRKKYGTLAEIAPLPGAEVTNPNVVIKAHKFGKKVDSTAGRIKNETELGFSS